MQTDRQADKGDSDGGDGDGGGWMAERTENGLNSEMEIFVVET